MRLNQLSRSARLNDDVFLGITPIFKVSYSGIVTLIGSGFWVTEKGHLVTAWHVIEDNLDKDGVDEGSIYAIQVLPDRSVIPRTLRKSLKHKSFDIALSETTGFGGRTPILTTPLPVTLDHPKVGSRIANYAFLSSTQAFDGEKYSGISPQKFIGTLELPELSVTHNLNFSSRIGWGYVTEIYPVSRDSVMLPFPCFQSDMPVYGANSGGPVFDEQGRVCAINCTSYAGADVAFHVPIKGILDLWARKISFIPEDPYPRNRSVVELGLAKRIPFDPPLIKVLFPFWLRLFLRPKLLLCSFNDRLRWCFFSKALKTLLKN